MINRRLFVFLVLGLALFSCSGDQESNESAASLSDGEINNSVLKAQIQNGLAAYPAWLAQWRPSIAVSPEGFELMRTDSIQDLTMPERNPILEDDPLYPYQFAHPEGNGRIDLYSSKVEARKNSKEAFFNPDSKVVWYREDGMKETLLFMGPSGMLEEGRWISSGEFLVLGSLQEENGYRPMVWLINLDEDRLYQYAYNQLSTDYDPTNYLAEKLRGLDLK
ncbi:hypothetical protein ACFOSV_15795 [Algoriphagus namhaensis]|uniref:Lipoprotein n=1 Tax=Algoriphagus namhaensis TaxID=915353 RepID=A0ABV8AUK8_9BACT